jgi:hypothetical protein
MYREFTYFRLEMRSRVILGPRSQNHPILFLLSRISPPCLTRMLRPRGRGDG